MSQPPPPGPPDPDRPPSPWEQPAAGPEPPGPGQPPQYGQPPSYGPPPGESPHGQHEGQQPPHGQHWGQQPPYAPQVPYGQYGPPAGPGRGGTNVLAILSLVLAFVFAPAGIVLGHLAKRQIRTTGEEGDQLATWGLILSYVFTGLGLLACCGWLVVVAVAGDGGGTTY
ncbi:DUF4190 domain-containing protein [Micromonospora deserti]|uniref:DUF4190 domain-containing protein n=1 Tax=Micromonospora deserti TaxID=2070366 RepID=A0A2W2CF89_9ACTN|nr:DUF4190 domain-containing protein [Micromonospora deserti]PZF97192.1 hypothetical protein C1I99_16030 [Micromonospora deserti]